MDKLQFLVIMYSMSAVVMAVAIQVAEGQVAEGVYPDGEIKYRCASRGYTAWWQRKTYFTFLTAYILVVPASVDDDTTSSGDQLRACAR